MVAATWNFHTRWPAYMHTIWQNFQPSTPSSSKVIAKKVQFQFLSRPLDQFLSRPSNLAKYYIILIHTKLPFKTIAQVNSNFLSRPLYSPLHLTGIKPSQNTNSDHFKTLILVYFQDHSRWTTHFSATKVWLACRGPATGIWQVEGSDHISITCIQHQQRYLVCHNHWLSQQRRIQMMEHITDIHRWGGPKRIQRVFKAIADTLEVLTSYWNHVDKIYSDIKQGDNESTDQLDQQIKNLIERCQYLTDEKLVCRTELFMPWNTLKSRSGCDQRNDERT